MLVQLLLLALAAAHVSAQACGYNAPYMYCSVKAVYIIDTTTWLPNGTIMEEFDFMRKHVIASTGWGTQEISFMSYGTGKTSTNPFTTSMSTACTMVNVLEVGHNMAGSFDVTLLEVMESYKVAYYNESAIGSPVILFSANRNQYDINQAADYVLQNLGNVSFTVVALNGTSNFYNNFPAQNVFDMPSPANPPHAITYCMAREACGYNGYCDTNTLPPNLSTPSPAPNVTSTVSSPPNAGNTTTSLGPGCGECDYSKIWNDVIYLVDASQASGSKSLADMIGLMQSSSAWYNVQRTGYGSSNYSMRVGVITYASNAQLVAPLGSVDLNDIYSLNPSYQAGDEGTNIEAAITMAVDQFSQSGHRASSKQVIVLMATTYNRGNYNAPQKAATTFIENGGVLIVYDYVPNHGEPSTELKELASPGYFLYSPNTTQTSLMDAQCDANCFCPPNFESLSQDARQTPKAGCYYAVDIRLNELIAKNNCKSKYNNGYISGDQSAMKGNFLEKGYSVPADYYIGLTYDSFMNQWVWADGTPLSGNYHPWMNGVAPTSDANGACVYVSYATQQWVQTNCRNAYYFTCESRPCASTNYCGVFTV